MLRLRLLGRLQAAYHLEDRILSEQSGAMGHSYPSHARQRTNRKTLLVNRRLRVRLMLDIVSRQHNINMAGNKHPTKLEISGASNGFPASVSYIVLTILPMPPGVGIPV